MSVQQWLLAEHQRRNQTTQDARALFAPHRQRVMQLLNQLAAPKPGSLCVLGAGNCNDLDLADLLNTYQQITLVDLDNKATEAAVASTFPSAVANADQASLRSRFHILENTDVTGIYDRLQSDDAKQINSTASAEILEQLSGTRIIPGAPFDCIASTCLLSQLIDSIVLTFKAGHSAIVPTILALRRQHLRTLVHSVVPGGRGLVIFDFVSSQSLPNLMQIDESQLNQTLIEALNAKNFFTGLNPFAVKTELQSHPDFVGRVTDVRLHPPWRWDIGAKQFAVSAISFVRAK